MNFPFTMSDKGVTIFIDGSPRMFGIAHPSFSAIRDAIEAGDEDAIRTLVNVKDNVAKMSFGRVKIMSDTIFVGDREVSGRLVDRILEMVSRGSNAIDGYVKFLDNLMDNPSKRAVDELYGFIEACDLPINENGNFLAYKKVRNDYTDIHSGTFDNSIGATPSMLRNEVDEDKNRTCSTGLHFCSYSYLPKFGWGDDNRVVVVEINPKDVVAIPADYNNSKGRTCMYKVVGEIEDWESTQLTPYYTDEYSEDDESEDDESDYSLDYSPIEDFYNGDYDSLEEALVDCGITFPDTVTLDYNDGENTLDVIVSNSTPIHEVDTFVMEVQDLMGDGLMVNIKVFGERTVDPAEFLGVPKVTPAPVATPTKKGSKLDEHQVREIRELLAEGMSYTAIGEQYDVDRRTVSRIDHGELWSSVT